MSKSQPASLKEFLATFTRPARRNPTKLLLDGFGADYYLLFDVEDDPEEPELRDTCNIWVVPLLADDPLVDGICLVTNANKHGVLRMLAAIGVSCFNDKVKTAFYAASSPLRGEAAILKD